MLLTGGNIMNNQSNDYYTNNDYEPTKNNFDGYDSGFGNEYYDFKSNPSLDSFNVKSSTPNIIVSIVFIIILFIIFYTNFPSISQIQASNNTVLIVQSIIIKIIPFILVATMLPDLGKSIDIAGRDITITKLFFFKERITIYDVDYCDYMTGLRTKNGTYCKLIIHYNKTSVSFTDTSFTNWGHLIKYMTKFDKIRHVDGRDSFTKFFDNLK